MLPNTKPIPVGVVYLLIFAIQQIVDKTKNLFKNAEIFIKMYKTTTLQIN